MPNWKKVVVSGSDAILNSLYVTGPITGSDITIDDWGSISASLASIEAGASSSNQNLQQVTDNGNSTTNTISVSGITVTGMGTGTDNSVVVKNSSNQLVTDEIDSRVWGSSLVDSTNGSNNRLATFTDSNSLNGEANLQFDGSTLTITGNTFTTNFTSSNDIKVGYVEIGAGTGIGNTLVGRDALKNNTSGDYSVAFGGSALANNTTGDNNTAVGNRALESNITGSYNTAVGMTALQDITSGSYNTAIGVRALKFLLSDYGSGVTDDRNTALGYAAFENLLGGVDNIAIGYNSPRSLSGQGASNASGSIYIGSQVVSAYNGETTPFQVTNNEIVIGTLAVGHGSNTVTIGNSDVTNNYFTGNISGSDVTIDDWGSISASLAQIGSGQFLTATNSPTKTEGSLKFNDSVKAIFGTGGDMEIYHDGSNSVIKDAGTGVLELQTNGTEIQLTGASGADYMARFINNGAVNLYYDNSKKLETTSTGATVTGDLDADDITIDGWGSISSSLASINATGSSQNLQQVTDNGATTTNAITVPELTLTGSLEISRGNGNKSSNIAIGSLALRDNTTGIVNTALGDGALKLNTTGRYNTAIGVNALGAGEDARYNVAVGEGALFYNDDGEDNVAIGVNAGWLTAASQPNLHPSESIFIGFEARSAYNANINMIVIGHQAVGRGDNTVVIGNSRTTDNYFFGNVSGSDVTIDDWGSVSASLASLEASANPTLQEVTNNGQTTSRDIILTNTSASFRNSSGNLSNLEHNKLGFTLDSAGTINSQVAFGTLNSLTSSFYLNHNQPVGGVLHPYGSFDLNVEPSTVVPSSYSSASFEALQIDHIQTQLGHNQVVSLFAYDRGITNATSSGISIYGPDAIFNQKKLVLTNITEISSSGEADAFDVYIKDWGSVSASLATLEASSSPTLQEVTDNGSTTTNSITISGSSADLTLTGGSTIETDYTTILSAKQTIPDNTTTTVFSVSVSTYVGAVIDYTFYDANRNNMRTGVVTAVANATATRHSELVTTDIGNTDALGVLVVLTGAGFGMRVSNETGTSFTAVCNIKLLKE